MPRQRKAANQDQHELMADAIAILNRLVLISRTLGTIALRFAPSRPRTLSERAHFLGALGFDRNEVAAILTTTAASVSVRLSERRAGKRKKRKPRGAD